MQTSDDAYENFILRHLQHYGLFTGRVSPSCSPRRDQSPGRGRWAITQDYQSDTHPSPPRSPDNITGDEEQDAEGPYPLLLTKPVRTRQLLLDFVRGRPIPRLREPRDLLAIPCLSSPFQGVRWPAECEVTVDDIQHIEWDPPEAEPFYQCTGHERTPMPVGDDRGRVVYAIDPATKMPYFTCSRVGGTRGPLKNPSCPNVPETSLSFESRFESGNLQKAVQVGVHDYELTLRHDLYTTKHTQWFYFRVENMKAGVAYRFTIVNLLKPSSLYSSGMRPLLYSKRAASEQGQGWTRTGTNIKYYRNNVEEDGRPLYSLTWTLEFPYGGDTCYLAHCYPYTFSQLQRYLYAVMARSSVAAYCKLRVLCRSIAGNPVYVLTITAPGNGSEESAVKPAVVLTARVHPGETNSSWIMQGFLDFILSDSPDACLLREMFVFKVIPMLNPDGVVVGNYRCSLAGRDLNRNYQTLLQESFPCVWYTRNMVKRLLSERDVILYCDLHGHSRKNNVFMYGCDSRHDTSVDLQERVFPLMMSKNAQDKFSFSSCKFQVQKSKEGTGRIVMWRLGIRNSYTMESTFGGSTLGNRTGTHFTTRDLKAIGFHLCDTLLDYCDPDESKAQQCLAELNTLVALKMRRKLGLGDIDFEGSLDIVSVSDFESSTGGSNSSESDGPPVHLMSSVKQSQIQPPKKQLRSRKERNRLHRKLTRRTISRSAPKSTDTMVTTQPQPQESQPCTMSKKKSQDILTMVKTQTRARAEIHQCAICFQTSAPNHDLGFGCSAQIRRGARMPHHSPQEMFLHTVEAYDISTALPKCYRGGHVACPGAQPRPISGSSVPVSVHKDKQGQALPIHTASLTLSPRYEACQGITRYKRPVIRMASNTRPNGWVVGSCQHLCVHGAKSAHHETSCPNDRGALAKVSIRCYMHDAAALAPSISNHTGKLQTEQKTEKTGHVHMKNSNKNLTEGTFSSKPKMCDTNALLPWLPSKDFNGKSYECSGDNGMDCQSRRGDGQSQSHSPRVIPAPPETRDGRFTLKPLLDVHRTRLPSQVAQVPSHDTPAENGSHRNQQPQQLECHHNLLHTK